MKLSDFHFDLPPDLIAQAPLAERSASRLLYLNRGSGAVSHHTIKDLGEFLQPGDRLVFNNTKVIPARVYGQKPTGGKLEVLVERVIAPDRFLAQIRCSKSPKPGSWIDLQGTQVEVADRHDNFFELVVTGSKSVFELLDEIGHMPLPPYITRADDVSDKTRYQTVYAKHAGAVAAPTAGLHFDEALLANLKQQGIDFSFVTLHVGAGTFQPVRVENIAEHQMHHEYAEVSAQVVAEIEQTKAAGGRVVAIGTTAVRSLETAALDGQIKPFSGETDIFIHPDNAVFNCIDGLLTNFHLPESTLIMLVSAFAGYAQTMNAYQAAVKNRYRFFSYGDAMLII